MRLTAILLFNLLLVSNYFITKVNTQNGIRSLLVHNQTLDSLWADDEKPATGCIIL